MSSILVKKSTSLLLLTTLSKLFVGLREHSVDPTATAVKGTLNEMQRCLFSSLQAAYQA